MKDRRAKESKEEVLRMYHKAQGHVAIGLLGALVVLRPL